jgi:hypothetical protein
MRTMRHGHAALPADTAGFGAGEDPRGFWYPEDPPRLTDPGGHAYPAVWKPQRRRCTG